MVEQRDRSAKGVPLKDSGPFADEARELAKRLPAGPEREAMIKKARRTKVAEDLDKWVSSPGLQPPR
jgi:hypothetical protein